MPGLILGLVLFGMGIALRLRSGLGLSPWDAFHQGAARHVPFSIGLVVILVSAVVLLAWIPLKQRVGNRNSIQCHGGGGHGGCHPGGGR